MFVGGEFYDDASWLLPEPAISTRDMYFLNGGKACLIVICEFLREHGVRRILLPSYLCPTILSTLEAGEMEFEFYRVNEDLSVDLPDLEVKCPGFEAVYFINYFGFLQRVEVLDYMKNLREKGVWVIEDNAQGGFHERRSGDFILNSMRKLAAYDGGYLITRQDVAPYIDSYRDASNRRLPLIRGYRAGLYRYLFRGKGSHAHLEEMFRQAERFYEMDAVVVGDPQERNCIERLDWQGIKRVRRQNYLYLVNRIAEIAEISPVFPVLQEDNLPMGLPVYFSGVERDLVNDELGKHGIGLAVHWDEIRTHSRTRNHVQAVQMAGRMLTLAIDQRFGREQMDYLTKHLIQGIETVKKARSRPCSDG